MAVDLDDAGIDHCVFEVRLIRASFEELCKHIGTMQIAELTECRAPVPKMLGQITTRRAYAYDPKNSLNEKPFITAATSEIDWLAQTIRLHLRPMGVSQNKTVHQKLESHQANIVYPRRP